MLSRSEIDAAIADARLEVQQRPTVTKLNALADVIVAQADTLARLDDPALPAKLSKAIHLEEWCPERARCSGTSAHSDAHAKVALATIRAHLMGEAGP